MSVMISKLWPFSAAEFMNDAIIGLVKALASGVSAY